MDLQLIKASKIKGKRVIVRVDLNSQETDKIHYRFLSTQKIISFLLKNKAKTIIVLAHLGRPESDKHSVKINQFDCYNEKLSLKIFKSILTKLYHSKVFFFKYSVFSERFEKYAKSKKLPRIILLENMRFYLGEDKNDIDLAKQIAMIGDIFIDEAFSVCHRKVATNNAITKLLPSFFGFNYLLEVKNLDKILQKSKRDLVVIVGGAKIKDKSEILIKFIEKSSYILIGGGVANSFIKAAGFEVGRSYFDEMAIPNFSKLDFNKIILPIDFKVLEISGSTKYKMNSEVGTTDRVLDLGNLTVQQYINYIKRAKFVL
jgi:phosphoglycerate kinase